LAGHARFSGGLDAHASSSAHGLACHQGDARRSVASVQSVVRKSSRRDGELEPERVKTLIAFLLLIVMLVLGARVRRVRDSFWKLLAFIAACIIVLALLLTILSK
jgi:hypothetical protein